jgi:hypothetical protein
MCAWLYLKSLLPSRIIREEIVDFCPILFQVTLQSLNDSRYTELRRQSNNKVHL